MFYNIFGCKLQHILLTLFFTFSVLATAKTSNEKEAQGQYLPHTIKLEQTNHTLDITLKDGTLVSLPSIVKVMIPLDWVLRPTTLERIVTTTIPTAKEMKEMQQLSDKLGVMVTDLDHLALYREAVKWLGTRYRWAGNSSKGVDCSGLTGILLKTVFNKDISRSSYLIADQLNEELEANELAPGDLVFFSTRRAKGINHVGVYLGDRQFIHASRKGVVVSSLDDKYYSRTFKKAGRI